MSIEGEEFYRPEWIKSGTGDEIPYYPTTNQGNPDLLPKETSGGTSEPGVEQIEKSLTLGEFLRAFLPPRETRETEE